MPSPPPIIRFGAFELDVRAGELRKRGLKIRLADQPLQILLLLLERPGDVLTREELRGKLWPADTFVDFDVGLSSAVRKLRDALGDSADNPQFIETLPRRGYRFIAPVAAPAESDGRARLPGAPKPIGEGGQSREDARAHAVPEPVTRPTPRPARRRTYWLAGAAALAVMLAAVAWYRLEADVTGMVAVQQQIARAVVSAPGGRVPRAAASSAQRLPVSAEAYDAYVKGLAAGGRSTYEGYRTAVAYFEEAVAKQPDYAEAWAEMARAQTQFLYVGPLSPREVMPKAEAAARKALQIDATVALGHQALAAILHNFYWQWKEGDEELRRARELTNSGEDQPFEAQALSRAKRFDEAIAQAERDRARDPLSFNANVDVAAVYRAAHQYDRAIAELRIALELNPDQARGHFQMAVTLWEMGRLHDAIGELELAVASSKSPRFQAYLGYAYAKAGRRDDARRTLKHLEARRQKQYVSSFGIALIYDALGEKDAALAAFERAYDDRAVEFSQTAEWPPFETIASDPRFTEPMKAIELRP